MKLLIWTWFILLSLVGGEALAGGSWPSDLHGKSIELKVGNAVIKGYHFVNANGRRNKGRPVVFLHGLMLNEHEFEAMIRDRMTAGDDCYVFNWRGHGNDSERSYVTNYQEGDYRFEHLVGQDFPAIVRAVAKDSGEKVTVVGHSMGGMVALSALGLGYGRDDVKSVVAIGSPAQILGRLNVGNAGWRDYLSNLLNIGPGDALLDSAIVFDTSQVVTGWNPFYPIVERTLRFVAPPFIHDLYVEARKVSDVGPAVWTRQIPADIIRSFDDFGRPGAGLKYRGLKIGVPVLHIVGDEDMFAIKRHIVRVARTQAADPGHWIVTLEGSGHMALVGEASVRAVGPVIDRFMKRPSSLGPANETHLYISAETLARYESASETRTCDNLLTRLLGI